MAQTAAQPRPAQPQHLQHHHHHPLLPLYKQQQQHHQALQTAAEEEALLAQVLRESAGVGGGGSSSAASSDADVAAGGGSMGSDVPCGCSSGGTESAGSRGSSSGSSSSRGDNSSGTPDAGDGGGSNAESAGGVGGLQAGEVPADRRTWPNPVEVAHLLSAAARLAGLIPVQVLDKKAWPAVWVPRSLRLQFHVLALRRALLSRLAALGAAGTAAAITELDVYRVALSRTRALEAADSVSFP